MISSNEFEMQIPALITPSLRNLCTVFIKVLEGRPLNSMKLTSSLNYAFKPQYQNAGVTSIKSITDLKSIQFHFCRVR